MIRGLMLSIGRYSELLSYTYVGCASESRVWHNSGHCDIELRMGRQGLDIHVPQRSVARPLFILNEKVVEATLLSIPEQNMSIFHAKIMYKQPSDQ